MAKYLISGQSLDIMVSYHHVQYQQQQQQQKKINLDKI